MCLGGGRSATEDYLKQARLARISMIKSKQRSRKASVNVITGGGTKEYRRSMATGAKQIGTTAAQESLRGLSAMFSDGKAKKERLRKEAYVKHQAKHEVVG